MVVTIFSVYPVFAAETIEPQSSRFKYYTVTDPEWQYCNTVTVTKKEHEQALIIETMLWNSFERAAGDDEIVGADTVISFIDDYIRDNNLDLDDIGTYTINMKNKIHYKEHLLTGEVYVELKQIIFQIIFISGSNSDTREITVTLR